MPGPLAADGQGLGNNLEFGAFEVPGPSYSGRPRHHAFVHYRTSLAAFPHRASL